MKRVFSLVLCLLFGLLCFAGCGPAEPEEKTVQACVQEVYAQFHNPIFMDDNAPIGEVCKRLGLTSPEETIWYLGQPDSSNILGRLFTTYVGYSIPNPKEKPTAEMPTDFVEYVTYWDGTPEDVTFALQMRDALTKLCGAPNAEAGVDGKQPLADADAKTLSAMQAGDSFGSDWLYLGTCTVSLEVYLSADGRMDDETRKGALLFTILAPIQRDDKGRVIGEVGD